MDGLDYTEAALGWASIKFSSKRGQIAFCMTVFITAIPLDIMKYSKASNHVERSTHLLLLWPYKVIENLQVSN